MKRVHVRVPWEHGLHFRPAARLVRLARQFHSTIQLRLGRATADVTSILSVVSLCAMMGMPLEIEASGDDEDRAVAALEQVFSDRGWDDDSPDVTQPPGVPSDRTPPL